MIENRIDEDVVFALNCVSGYCKNCAFTPELCEQTKEECRVGKERFKKLYADRNVFNDIKQGLQEAIDYERGKETNK